MIGSTVGDYRITEKLGQGGFGVVWKATEESLERAVALKTMDVTLAQDARFRERFFAEAKVQAKLVHPNIVTIHRFFEHEGRYFIAMEYLEGVTLPDGGRARTLADLVRRGPMLEGRMVAVFRDVLAAVACAHDHDVLHRDIKPLNILFAESGLVKVADFGIAKIVGGETSVSVSGTRVGTSGYMSPEQVLNKPLDRRSDIYALGITLYEMATGQLPFKATSTTSLEEQHLFQPPPPVREVNPSVSADLAGMIARALAKKPEDRYQNCEEFASALRVLGRAPARVEVPSVLGRYQPDAEQSTELAGLRLVVEGDDFSDVVPAGKALRQTPAPGSLCEAGATVRVVLSRGRQPASMHPTVSEPERRESESFGSRPEPPAHTVLDKEELTAQEPHSALASPAKKRTLAGSIAVAVVAVVAVVVVVLLLLRGSPGGSSMHRAWREVKPLAQAYYEVGTSFDVDRELSYWRFPAEEYYGRVNRSEEQVRSEAVAVARRTIKVEAALLELRPLNWESSSGRLQVKLVYRYHWRRTDTGAEPEGVSDVTLTWQRAGNEWRIVAAREQVTPDTLKGEAKTSSTPEPNAAYAPVEEDSSAQRREARRVARARRRDSLSRTSSGRVTRVSSGNAVGNPMQLRAILTDASGNRCALIGERRVYAGDTFAGRRIDYVSGDGVRVSYRGNTYTVRVGEQVATDSQASLPGLHKLWEFGAMWCPPCKQLKPTIEALKKEYEGKIEVRSIDTDQNKELAQKFNITAIPTLVFLDTKGNELSRIVGLVPRESIVGRFRVHGFAQ